MPLRWGLCCQFLDAPIRFRTATHRYVWGLDANARREYLAGIAAHNAAALADAVHHCSGLGIGAFRMNSQILPLATHPESGYRLQELDPGGTIEEAFRAAGTLARTRDVRLSFHPDQFVVLNSARPEVVDSAVGELEHQAYVAELVGADPIVLHGGSGVGGMDEALIRLGHGLDRLTERARVRIALENDDRFFAPRDLLPLCRDLGVPLVYDVHHHRCRPDDLTVGEATDRAAETWRDREPYGHISSPRDGWNVPNPRPHADYIDPDDFPDEWLGRAMTIDVEAKEKERAVLAISAAVRERGARASGGARSRRR
jgi:UV DNA damage endonuclease